MNPTTQTLDLLKKALGESSEELAKAVSTGTGLVAYDLQAPAKDLWPAATPIRNVIPRVGGGTGTATNWKQITTVTGSGYDAMAWIPEGQRPDSMSYSSTDKAASYKTLGEEDSVTFEAQHAGKNFEDVKATGTLRCLIKMMLKEENAILGGNFDVALGTPGTPTLSAGGTGATLPGAPTTYSVIVVALTYEGYQMATLSTAGVLTSKTVTGNDGQTYTLNAGSSMKSAAATQAITLGEHLSMSVAPVTGAVAYAWYIGTAGNEKLEAITTINSHKQSVALVGTYQAATAITADKSVNTLGFNGLLYSAFKSGSGAYLKSLATGTAGTGSTLTTTSDGGIQEIDDMLFAMWRDWQISPNVIYVNGQEARNIKKKILTNGSAPLLQIVQNGNGGGISFTAGGEIRAYFNPFALDGGVNIPIKLHPKLPPGTMIAWNENLPAQYQNHNTPNVAEMKIRQEYYQIDWPLKTRKHEFGVYCEEVLAVYAPFALGVIGNIANG